MARCCAKTACCLSQFVKPAFQFLSRRTVRLACSMNRADSRSTSMFSDLALSRCFWFGDQSSGMSTPPSSASAADKGSLVVVDVAVVVPDPLPDPLGEGVSEGVPEGVSSSNRVGGMSSAD